MTASIVGWAHTPFGKFDTETVESLVVRVATDAMADAVRTIWTLGPPDRPDLVTGMDFALLENDQITRLYAFVDEPE